MKVKTIAHPVVFDGIHTVCGMRPDKEKTYVAKCDYVFEKVVVLARGVTLRTNGFDVRTHGGILRDEN